MTALDPYFKAIGRALLSFIFIWAGFGKIAGYAGSQGYMEKFGVPGELLPLVIITELGGGLAILVAGLVWTFWVRNDVRALDRRITAQAHEGEQEIDKGAVAAVMGD